MIALIRMEYYKLWRKRQIVVLFLIVFILNLGLLLYTQQQQTIPIQAYDKLQKELSSLPNTDRYEWIDSYSDQIEAFSILSQMQALQSGKPEHWENMIASLRLSHPDIEEAYGQAFQQEQNYMTGSLELEAEFMKQIKQEMDILHDMPKRLDEIQKKADAIGSISIFSQEQSFSSRNIKKTAQDFQKMKDVEIIYQLEKGLVEALSFPVSNFLIILMMLAIAASMILDEKSKNLFSIVRTCVRGKHQTILAKCIVMLTSIGLLTTLLTVSNLCVMQQLCDFGDLHASLISLASYAKSIFPISILQYLVLFLLVKWMAAGCIGCFMLAVSISCRYKITCFTAILVFLGLQLLCYTGITDNSTFTIFKYLNVISFLQSDVLFRTYLNLNIAQHAISLQSASFVCLFAFLALFLIVSCWLYDRKQNLQIKTWQLPAWITQHLPASKRNLPVLWIQECHQLFWIQKGLIFLLCFLCLQGYTYQQKHLYVTQDEKNWMQYMKILEGKPDKKKDAFLASQQKTYEQLHTKLDEIHERYDAKQISSLQKDQMESAIMSQLYGETFFQQLAAQYHEVKLDQRREMITPFGYEQLLFQDSMTLVPAILALLFLFMSLSNMQCITYQHAMNKVIYATIKGRSSLLFHKLSISLLCGLIYAVLAFVFDLVLVYQTYGFPSLQASLVSMTQFTHMNASISIFGFLCISYLIRLFAIETSICILFALSVACRHQLHTLFLLCLIIVIPLLLPLMGIHYLDTISLYPLFQNASYFSSHQTMIVLSSLLCYLCIAIGCIYYANKHSD